MNTIKRLLRRALHVSRKTMWLAAMMIMGGLAFYVLVFILGPFAPLSRYPAAILHLYFGLLALVYMDKVHHVDVDTRKAIEEKNTAYGQLMLAYAIIIAAVMMTV